MGKLYILAIISALIKFPQPGYGKNLPDANDLIALYSGTPNAEAPLACYQKATAANMYFKNALQLCAARPEPSKACPAEK